MLTGCYCPGCGSLRALHQLLHGRLVVALGLNPLMVISTPYVAYSLVTNMLTKLGWPIGIYFVRPGWIWVLLVIVVTYWVLRNIPSYPFSLLAP